MRKVLAYLAAALLFVCFTQSCATAEKSPMSQLCERIVPSHAGDFVFELCDTTASGNDVFSIYSRDGKIVIAGNDVNSQAVGLNYYLKNYCNAHVSWYASDPVIMPAELPMLTDTVTIESRVGDRFFLNYCTFGYTMPYWKWNDWERFIDWMALNGVTMPLAITGQESVWYRVWSRLGLSDEQIRNYFTGPAQLPWHRMSNVDYWQSPLPTSWLEQQEQLQKQILERERALGMTPVLPAFSGHVPGELQEVYPDARIHTMSKWGGFDDKYRSHFIEPMDTLYTTIQKMYLEEQTKLYGTDHIYGIDPFNEVESPDWSEEFLANVASTIYESLTQVDPDAKWLQMTWLFFHDKKHWTPECIKAYLTAVPDGKLMLLDYFCDHTEIYRDTENYYGNPYIWCYLGNFGGNTMLVGNIDDVEMKVDRVKAEGGNNAVGLGVTLEGLDVNPHMYEFVMDQAWNMPGNSNDWVDMWARTRGGDKSEAVVEAWRMLHDSIYNHRVSASGQSVLINARPMLEGLDGWSTNPDIHYNNMCLYQIWSKLLDAEGVDENPGYRFDVMNIGRQALGNCFVKMREDFNNAYKARDIDAMKRIAADMDTIIADTDRLLSTDANQNMGKWIADARDFGVTDEEKAYYEQNARGIVTVWGQKATQLNDYANRGWAGLTKDFYGTRWKKFTDAVIAAVEAGQEFDAKQFREDITEFEYQWTLENKHYPIVSGENPVEVARELNKKYARLFTEN